MKQVVTTSGFDGVIGVYMLDLQNGQEIHFALNKGQDLSVDPDVAFTASSTIKIPILVSYFIQHGTAPVDDSVNTKILNMIHKSDNVASDDVMAELDPNTGPLVVTAGYENISAWKIRLWQDSFTLALHYYKDLIRLPINALILITSLMFTTRPLHRIWACCWKMFTNAQKQEAAH